MDKLRKIIEAAVLIELEDSCQKYERRFHSDHEAYGVLLEEVAEAKLSMRDVKKQMHNLFSAIYCNSDSAVKETESNIEKYAIEAACECIQVAAMARKGILTIEERKG